MRVNSLLFIIVFKAIIHRRMIQKAKPSTILVPNSDIYF